MSANKIRVRLDPKDIIMLDNIIEGFDGLAIVSTGNPKTGEVVVHVTPDTRDDVLEILKRFPRGIELLG
jgi:uncharacterized protein (UPF0218 family)